MSAATELTITDVGTEEALGVLGAAVQAGKPALLPLSPLSHDTPVFKDLCLLCFHTPFSPGGLFVSLHSFECVCTRHLAPFNEITGQSLFLQIESHKQTADGQPQQQSVQGTKEDEERGEPTNKISRLAIDQEKIEIKDKYALVIVSDNSAKRCEINEQLDANLLRVCQFVREATSAERLQLLQQTGDAWDGEAKIISKHSNTLKQVEGKKVAPHGWKCETEGCDLTENLWLNLGDGSIRCGRSQFIAEGQKSKGNGHMQSHYDKTGNPLAVKLGTITRNLDLADVYSYDESSNVLDTELERHLLHFGLDPATLEKTEKSTLEMELDINQKWEWQACQEDGVQLETLYGPGYTGLVNLGNSCYMNSVMQTLLQVPEFRTRFGISVLDLARSTTPLETFHTDFNVQTTKLVHNMLSGDYAIEGSEHNGIKPTQFKRVTAGTHPEFSTGRQQDAEEFLRYFLDKISENTANGQLDPTIALKFKVEDRFEDNASRKVRYSTNEECVLRMPMNSAVHDPLPDRPDRLVIQMEACFEEAFGDTQIDGYKSPITGEVKGAKKRQRMVTFPDFLVLQMEKFTLTNTGELKKKDIEVQVHETIDLSMYKALGMQNDEEPLPEGADEPIMKLPPFDQAVVQQLVDMGFSENAATKAAIEAKKNNAGAENAMEWIMIHMEEPDLNSPPAPVAHDPTTGRPLATGAAGGIASQAANINPTYLDTICSLGFTPHQARYALLKHSQLEVATDWLFNNAHEVPPETEVQSAAVAVKKPEPSQSTIPAVEKTYRDGGAQYQLAGFISHIGRSPHAGHYVAHIFKDGHWVLFNDEKVAKSQAPPMSLAYLYLYRRVSSPDPSA